MTRPRTLLFAFAAVVSVAAAYKFTPRLLAAEGDATAATKGYFLEEEPEESQGVMAVRHDAKHGEEIFVIGRIGGRKIPWIKGAAAFSIVDTSIVACNEILEDRCPTPWDFCCEADLPQKTLLVMFVDNAGKVLKKDAREMLKLKELQTVVIEGKVKLDAKGNVTILASRLFVREDEPETL
jgi:hypothetical protein